MALFGWDNAIDGAGVTLAATAAVTGFGPEMLRIPLGSPATAWQTPSGVTTATLTITSSAALAWRVAVLARTNLTSAATIRVRLGGAYDSGTISAGVAVGVGQALHILPAATSAVEMQITLADPTNPDGFLNVPLAFAGAAQEFDISPQSQPDRDIRRDDQQSRGGSVTTVPLSQARRWRIQIGMIRESAAGWLPALETAAGQGRNILFVPRTALSRASSEAVLGLLTPGATGFLGPSGNFRTWSGSIIERL